MLRKLKFNLILLSICGFQIFWTYPIFSQEQESDQQKVEKFKRETIELYQNLGIQNLVDFDSFTKAYMGFFLYKNRLNGKPLISFLNYSIPNNQERFITIDFVSRTIQLRSKAGHGVNSTCTTECGREQTCCQNTWGKPGVIFSNREGSWRSSIGLLVAGEKVSPGGKIGENLVLRGLEPTNSLAESRGIKFHTGHNGEFYGVSQGCITLPGNEFRKGYEMLSNKTLIYAFEGNARQSYAGFQNENEVLKAARIKEGTGFVSVPTVSATFTDKTMADSKAAKATRSLASRAYPNKGSYSGFGMWGDSSDTNKLPIPENVDGITILKGSKKFEECQLLSDSSWKDTVAFINQGGNPSERFRGQWMDFDKWAAENGYNDGETQLLAQKRTAIVNDCVAMAHISTRTDFDKKNINEPETRSTADGKITCVYKGPESQDYQSCLRTISIHDALLAAETNVHDTQNANYSADAANRLNLIRAQSASGSQLSQGNIVNQAKSFTDEAARLTQARANISQEKLNALKNEASQIPTRDSLYDECVAKFTKHGTVGMDDFNDVSNIYMKDQAEPYTQERDYCLQAVSSQVQPIHNQKAREEIKGVLKSFGEEVVDYESKSKNLLTQSATAPAIGDSYYGFAISGKAGSTPLVLKENANQGADSLFKDIDSSLSANAARNLASTRNAISSRAMNNYKKDRTQVSNKGKGFQGSDFSLTNTYGSASGGAVSGSGGSGIYNEEFYTKINLALQHPDQLDSLHLSEDQLKEYYNQKNYFDSFKTAKNEMDQARSPASKIVDLKEQTPSPIADKEMNLFEIISLRYTKKFYSNEK
jgi:hypothetical protein